MIYFTFILHFAFYFKFSTSLAWVLILMSFYSAITGRESGSNKKLAAQSCSLSVVRQLFHLGAIEAALPGQLQPKKQKTDEVSVYDFSYYKIF